jgi:hypothetical protein
MTTQLDIKLLRLLEKVKSELGTTSDDSALYLIEQATEDRLEWMEQMPDGEEL